MSGDWLERQEALRAALDLAPSQQVWACAFVRRGVHGGPLSLPGLTSQSLAARHAPVHVAVWLIDAAEGSRPVCVFPADPSARTTLTPGEATEAMWRGTLEEAEEAVGVLVVAHRSIEPTSPPGPPLATDPCR